MSHLRLTLAAVLVSALVAALAVAADSEVSDPKVVQIPAGAFIAGSDAGEREAAYRLDAAAYGHSRTRERQWYAREGEPRTVTLGAYEIAQTPITNAQYAMFIKATGHRRPTVTRAEWQSYGLVHPYERARRHIWPGDAPPTGRAQHPVVLVSFDDAEAYAHWLSRATGQSWRLPTEAEWMKAARGTDGRVFPWGDEFDASRLNSHDQGPFDTMPVGSYPSGASPFGMLDAAGQVFEWTSTAAGNNRHIVKGGSWDDKGCGVCRPAARHSRPDHLKHILIGFRLVRDSR